MKQLFFLFALTLSLNAAASTVCKDPAGKSVGITGAKRNLSNGETADVYVQGEQPLSILFQSHYYFPLQVSGERYFYTKNPRTQDFSLELDLAKKNLQVIRNGKSESVRLKGCHSTDSE